MDISIKGKNRILFISKNHKEIKINKYYDIILLFSLDFNANSKSIISPLLHTLFDPLSERDKSISRKKTKINKSSKAVSPKWKTLCYAISYSFNDGSITLPIELEKTR